MTTRMWLLIGLCAVLSWPLAVRAQAAARYDCEDDLIEVMFDRASQTRLRDGSPVDLQGSSTNGIDALLRPLSWHRWDPLSSIDEAKVDEYHARGEARTGRPLYNLNNILRLAVPKEVDVWELSDRLEALPGVLRARPVPRPVLPPLPSDYGSQQKYLDPAANTPTGVDASYAWTWPGGAGDGVTVCDLEYFWSYTHADVTKAVGAELNVDVVDPGFGPDHGTAVIGQLVADDNGWGITGICHASALRTCGTYFGVPTASWNVPGALAVAIANLQSGDVILLENQWDLTGQGDYVPIEWWTDFYPSPQSFNAVYAAIENAVANGIHVVETGGNGEGDSGVLQWYGDSGAIVVGAGGAYDGGTFAEGDLQKLSFSTYGPRFDLQGWGEDVVTTGYGDLYNAEGPDYFYTSAFGGTSAAGPIVAGAVAACVGFYTTNISATPPSPALIRELLKSTGTPQVTPPVGNIGSRPNLRAAFAALQATAVDGQSTPMPRVHLEQNVPNPLNPSSLFRYSILDAGNVTLFIYDGRGRTVRQLVDAWHGPGEYSATWDGRDLHGDRAASGVYLVRLQSHSASVVIKATLLK